MNTLLKERFQKWPLDKTLSQLGFPSLKLNEELFIIVHHKGIGSLRNHGQNNFLVVLQNPMATTIQSNQINTFKSDYNNCNIKIGITKMVEILYVLQKCFECIRNRNMKLVATLWKLKKSDNDEEYLL